MSKSVISIIAGILLLCTGYLIYHLGSVNGAHVVQTQWDSQKILDLQANAALSAKYTALENQHKKESDEATDALKKANEYHQTAVDQLRTDYADRLLLSTKRADIYKRQAESGASKCRDLASYTAQLDGSLEAGRLLVGQLKETIGLRDRQITAIGDQLLSDRKLIIESQAN